VGHAFVPDSVHVEPGDTVRWTQMDPTTHSSNGNGDESWYSGGLTINKTFQHVFANKGTFVYRCTFHNNMHGQVSVGMGGPTAVFMSPREMPGVTEVEAPLRDVRGRSIAPKKAATPASPAFVKPVQAR
jgi:hypothetical protein